MPETIHKKEAKPPQRTDRDNALINKLASLLAWAGGGAFAFSGLLAFDHELGLAASATWTFTGNITIRVFFYVSALFFAFCFFYGIKVAIDQPNITASRPLPYPYKEVVEIAPKYIGQTLVWVGIGLAVLIAVVNVENWIQALATGGFVVVAGSIISNLKDPAVAAKEVIRAEFGDPISKHNLQGAVAQLQQQFRQPVEFAKHLLQLLVNRGELDLQKKLDWLEQGPLSKAQAQEEGLSEVEKKRQEFEIALDKHEAPKRPIREHIRELETEEFKLEKSLEHLNQMDDPPEPIQRSIKDCKTRLGQIKDEIIAYKQKLKSMSG